MGKTLKGLTDPELVAELHKRCHEVLSGELKAVDDGFPNDVWPHPYPEALDVAGLWDMQNEFNRRVSKGHPSAHLDLLPSTLALDLGFDSEFSLERGDENETHAAAANRLSLLVARTVVEKTGEVEEHLKKTASGASDARKASMIRDFFYRSAMDMVEREVAEAKKRQNSLSLSDPRP